MNIMNNIISEIDSEGIKNKNLSLHPGLAGLLIDMQPRLIKRRHDGDKNSNLDYNEHENKFCNKNYFSAHDINSVIQSQIEMIKYFAQTNVPIIDINYEEDRTIKPLRLELKKVPNVMHIEKNGFNAFDKGRKHFFESYKDGYLKKILQDMNIKEIFVMGIYASSCAYNTAVGGIRAGFNVSTADTVIADPSNNLNKSMDKHRSEYVKNKITFYDTHDDFIKSLRNK